MAIVNANGIPPVRINSADTYNFGDGGSGNVNTTVLNMVSSSFSGTVTVVARAKGTSDAFKPYPYTSQYLNGAVGTGLPVVTAITDTSIVTIDSTGQDIGLDCTPYTSGDLYVTASRNEG